MASSTKSVGATVPRGMQALSGY